jgi:hypothetical protein
MNSFRLFVVFGIALLPAGLWAGESLTLDDAIRRALDRHPQRAIKHAEIKTDGGRLMQARAWPNPHRELSRLGAGSAHE